MPAHVERIAALPTRQGPRNVSVFVPEHPSGEPLRVLVLLDGQNVLEAFQSDSAFGATWRVDVAVADLMRSGRMPPVAVVGVWNGGASRPRDYLPPDFRTNEGLPGHAHLTASMLIDDVLPVLSERFGLSTEPAHRVLGGSSMGGLMALWCAWNRPGVFGGLIAMSPAHWRVPDRRVPGDFTRNGLFRMIAGNPGPPLRRLWIDSGTRSCVRLPRRTVRDDGAPETALLAVELRRRGFVEGGDLRYTRYRGASHDEAAWALRLPQALEFTFSA